MEKLLALINSLTPPEQIALANRCGTTVGYLRKAVSKGQLLGPSLCVAIEKGTDGKVTRKDLRHDDWLQIWPELATAA